MTLTFIFFLSVQIAAWEAMDPDDRPQNFLPKKLVVVFIHKLLYVGQIKWLGISLNTLFYQMLNFGTWFHFHLVLP